MCEDSRMPSNPNLRQAQATGSYDTKTALSVVIANMIGTGVFTSLGYQLLDIQSGFVILTLWFIGGITALCGALSFFKQCCSVSHSHL